MSDDVQSPGREKPASPPATGRPRVVLWTGFVAFLALLGYLVASSLSRRSVPTFAPSPVGTAFFTDTGAVTLTVDARDPDAWRYVDLDAGAALAPADSTGWDLAVRRFRIRALRPVAELGRQPAAKPYQAPVAGPAGAHELGRWYSYGALSHLLQPTGRVYSISTDAGRTARVEIVSYYCPGLEAGCLTLRYRLQ